MGSVCGQHDFVDLVGFNDAILCGRRRVCVTQGFMEIHAQEKPQEGNMLCNRAAKIVNIEQDAGEIKIPEY